MARIPEQEIERLKLEVNLAELVRAHGTELRDHGKDLIGHCPFHDDRTPSLVVSPDKNLWHCLGACQAGGTVIDWIMRTERVSFRHAVEILRLRDPGIILQKKETLGSRKLPSPLSVTMNDSELMRKSIEYYHETLKQAAPEAIRYLEERGISDLTAIDHFKIGFANRTLGLRIPMAKTREGLELRTRLQELGVYRESGHEHFMGSITFPISDEEGNVTEVYGRKITKGLRQGTQQHTYLPGPHRGVWNLEGLHATEVILCEAIIDALSFWVSGFKNVTAAYGIEGFTKDHQAAFLKYGVRCVYIAYDRDEAGDRAAEKLAKRLLDDGIETRRVLFPRGMDANEFILKVKPPHESLKLALQSAEWMGKLRTAEMPPPAPIEKPAWKSESEIIPSPAPRVQVVPDIFKTIPQVSEPKALLGAPLVTLSEEIELRGEDIVIRFGPREYRVRGLSKNLSFEVLRVNIRAAENDRYHVDTIDLYQAKARSAFITAANSELQIPEETIKRDLGRVLFRLEEMQEKAIREKLGDNSAKKEVHLTDVEKNEAMALLQSPNLLDRILKDFEKAGVIGEEVNKLVGYLAATSRKLEDPLAIVIQSSSAAGKSSLMEAILSLIPEEDKVQFSSMTGQSLFYMGEKDLKHRILAIAEEEGARQAAYALKLLQSEGQVSIASTGKDATTGKLVTHQYRVEGPVMIFLTTTAIEIDEELLNRCIVLSVNETREQTRLIHDMQRQRQTLEGLLDREERGHILKLHQNAQRLLRPVLVANPFAKRLTFLDSRTRSRRDHVKYLTLIRTIALLHQYGRESKWTQHRGESIEYIEVTAQDIEIANRLCHQVLGRSLDELPPQTRRLLSELTKKVKAECESNGIQRRDYRFTRRDVRALIGWSDFQVHVHLQKLVTLEYALVHRGGRGQSFVYELLFDGEACEVGDDPVLSGLVNASVLSNEPVTQRLLHPTQSFLGGISPHLVPNLVDGNSPESRSVSGISAENTPSVLEKGTPGVKSEDVVIADRIVLTGGATE